MRVLSRCFSRTSVGCLLLGGLLGAAGCGGSTGTITGKVYYKNGPVKGGNVSCISDAQKTSQMAEIGEDGSFKLEKIPLGAVTFTVDTSSFKPLPALRGVKPPPGAKAPGGYDMEARAKRYTPIPPQYATPEKSGLKYTVKSGSQEHDLKLD